MPPIIELEQVRKVYDTGVVKVEALRGVSLTIHRGEMVALMGASGSGKTTLMNLLGCLDRVTSGTYRFNGEDVSRLNKAQLARLRNAKIGFVFQSFNLLKRQSAWENVALPLVYAGASGGERKRKAMEMLQLVGLTDRAHHKPNELSGGQQQRVAIARALVNTPQVLLADEPTGNLDSKTSEEILAELQRLNRELGQTIVLVTHEADVADHASRIIVVRDGLICSDRPNTHPRTARCMPAVLESEGRNGILHVQKPQPTPVY